MSNVLEFRKFAPPPEEEMRIIHSPFNPADVHSTDPLSAEVLVQASGFKSRFPVYRISPLGVELDCRSISGEDCSEMIKAGSQIDLRMQIGKHQSEFNGLVVATKHHEAERDLFGVRWCQVVEPRNVDVERRKLTRWLCGDEFLPTGIAPNPTRFNDYVYFKVHDISKEGMQISTSLRNKFLIRGMVLEAMASFPMVGQVQVNLKILNARIRSVDGRELLSLGTEVVDPDRRVLETIGQYLLQFGSNTTAIDLKREGLPVRSVATALDFSFVKTAEDYNDVLRLRKLAYSAGEKIDPNTRIEEMGDIFDSRARIVMARHMGKSVGSLRLMFHDPEDLMEHEQFTTLPNDFPRKDELVEVTRVCTDPAYRGSDLFYALMKQMILAIAQSKRRWLVGSATVNLWPLYRKMGFHSTGIKYCHEHIGNEEHEIFLGDVPKMISGVGVGPALWNELYADVSDYLRDLHGFEFDPMMNVRMATYRALKPFTFLFSAGIRKPGKIN